MPGAIGAIVSSRLASFAELSTTLGLQDAYDILEIIAVDAHNRRVIRDHEEKKT